MSDLPEKPVEVAMTKSQKKVMDLYPRLIFWMYMILLPQVLLSREIIESLALIGWSVPDWLQPIILTGRYVSTTLVAILLIFLFYLAIKMRRFQ